jgi:hypothetical protein
MLEVDYQVRPDSISCLKHPWFDQVSDLNSTLKVDKEILLKMKNFKQVHRLRLILLNILCKSIPLENYKVLDINFRILDRDGKGVIDYKDLKFAFED